MWLKITLITAAWVSKNSYSFRKKRCKLLKRSVELGVRLSHDFAPFHTESVVMRSFVKLKPSDYSDFQKIESVNQNIC